MTNPQVYMDITQKGKPLGRIIIELFADMTPLTAEYFRALCSGERGGRLHYKDSIFQHMVVQGLDVLNIVTKFWQGPFKIAYCGKMLSFRKTMPREEYDKFVPVIDEHQKDVDHIKLELEKLFNKEANLQSLLANKAEMLTLEEEFKKLLSEIQTKITNIKNKILLLKAVPSLSDEGIADVQRAIKKFCTDTPGVSGSY